MRKLFFIASLMMFTLTSFSKSNELKLSLAGKWKIALDAKDEGIVEKWNYKTLTETIMLPGSLQEQGYGYDVGMDTPWTGLIVDNSWYTAPKYEKYRKEGNIKIPFWLKPEKHYVGVAWYQKEVNIPKNWEEKVIFFNMERAHWETVLFVDGKRIGANNSLGAPHRYEIGTLKEGKHTITVRVDNRMHIKVGMSSHSLTDHTQTNWNGIIGDIFLESLPAVYLDKIVIHSDLSKKEIEIEMNIVNTTNRNQKSKLKLSAAALNHGGESLLGENEKIVLLPGNNKITSKLSMGSDPMLWSEFSPNLYELQAVISYAKTKLKKQEIFGIRELKKENSYFTLNDQPVFFRGIVDCSVSPLTGYPATDDSYWEKMYKTIKAHGFNHVRFHSWCPPKAAFSVADKEGIYLQVECNSWATTDSNIGDGDSVDEWLYRESERIIEEYGNHPSFCMLAYGNEPSGSNQKQYLTDLIEHWREIDGRRLYTGGAGWPFIESSDYFNSPAPRIQGWGEGLKSIINAKSPQTAHDYEEIIQKSEIPIISHEAGQWCAYPNFKEIPKYTGVLKASNLEIFQETLNENNMGHLAEDFLMASGKLQVLCYKADIEASLRTPDFAGFQVLDIRDCPGYGTSLIGVVDPFWDSKGYVTPDEYSRFCNSTVPLARMEQLNWKNSDTFKAKIEVSHFERDEHASAVIYWKISDKKGNVYKKGEFKSPLPIDNCIEIGDISFSLNQFKEAKQLNLEVSIPDKDAVNDWNFWVFPEVDISTNDVLITDTLDSKAKDILNKGGKVMLALKRNSLKPEKGGDIKVGFSSIFWNTAWTVGQAPHTLGILCDPAHPALSKFPTEYHSDFQWWDIMSGCDAIVLDDFPADFFPIVHIVDDWFENRKLGIVFEAKIGEGKLLMTSVDFNTDIENRISAKQFQYSLLEYMKSAQFSPEHNIDISLITNLLNAK